MKNLALLSIFLALPLCAQDAKVAPPPPATVAPAEPTPLTAEKQVDLLIKLTDYQGAWINRLQKLAESKASSADLKASEDAGQAYMAALSTAKADAKAVDTDKAMWVWVFAQKKWIAQPIGASQ